jgi:hypothetical protein
MPPMRWLCTLFRVLNTAADWVGANLGTGPVVSEKFVGGSNWSSAYIYTTQQVCVSMCEWVCLPCRIASVPASPLEQPSSAIGFH